MNKTAKKEISAIFFLAKEKMSTRRRQSLLGRLEVKKQLVIEQTNNAIDKLIQEGEEIKLRTSQEMTNTEKNLAIAKLQPLKTAEKERHNKAVDIIVAARESL